MTFALVVHAEIGPLGKPYLLLNFIVGAHDQIVSQEVKLEERSTLGGRTRLDMAMRAIPGSGFKGAGPASWERWAWAYLRRDIEAGTYQENWRRHLAGERIELPEDHPFNAAVREGNGPDDDGEGMGVP